MVNLRTHLLAFAAILFCAWGLNAQITATDAFTTAPRKVLPLLDNNARLDMVDYFNSNMTTGTGNAYGGKSRITAISPEKVTVAMTDASTWDFIVLPGKTPMIAVITTVATPAPDSRMTVYSQDWSRDMTAQVFKKPTLDMWLTPEGKKNRQEVEMNVPFMLVSYSYDPATQTLTLTNNVRQFAGDEVYAMVEKYLLPKLTYRYNQSSGKFAAEK